MQKLSVRKLSILGLVLLTASAVTAAMLPNGNKPTQVNGSLTGSPATSRISCTASNDPQAVCTRTTGAGSITTAGSVDSDLESPDTANNTTGAPAN